jgi:hypothetical protein
MKKAIRKKKSEELETDEMLPEYDFSHMKGGVRGKYSKAYRNGHTVKIHKTDDTTTVQNFKLEEGAVVLAPDVRKYFPDADAVNDALRRLIPLIAGKSKSKAKA